MPRRKPIEKLAPTEPEIEISHPDAIALSPKVKKSKPSVAKKLFAKVAAIKDSLDSAIKTEPEPAPEPDTKDAKDEFSVSFRSRAKSSSQTEDANSTETAPSKPKSRSKRTLKSVEEKSDPGEAHASSPELPVLAWRSTGASEKSRKPLKNQASRQDASPSEAKVQPTRKPKLFDLDGSGSGEAARLSAEPSIDLDDPTLGEFSFAFRPGSELKGTKSPRGRKPRVYDEADLDQEAGETEDDSLSYEEAVPELVPEPEPEEPPVSIPSAAPQVIMRGGIPTLVSNQTALPPFFFSVFEFEPRAWTEIASQIKYASEAGIHLLQLGMTFSIGEPVESLLSDARVILERVIAINPAAKVVFLLNFKPPHNWKQQFPSSINGHAPKHPSTFDLDYWTAVENHLGEFTSQLRSGVFGSHVMGIHLGKDPWKREAEEGYDTSPAGIKAFQKWCRSRYQNDIVTLRAAWFDGEVEFDSIRVPEFEPEGAEGERFVRSSRKQRRVVDYHMFLSDTTVQRIRSLAAKIKRASEGWFLVGVGYGYTFEWSHPSSCHLALGKLLRAAEIDFISGPPSYRERSPGGTATIPLPVDSCALNGKLFISDEDFKTSLSRFTEADVHNPVLNNPQALEAAHWRGVGAALAHASGINWCDTYGEGWLKFPGIWQRAAKIKDLLIQRMGTELQDPEVVVFVDERSLAYLVDPNAFLLLVQNVCDSAHRAGMRIGYYLLSDLAHRERFPDAKLYIFLNAWDMRSPLRTAVQSRLHRDGKVLLWLYAAALLDGGREAMDRVREVVGIALKPQPFFSKSGTVLVDRRHSLSGYFPDQGRIGGSKLEPSYFAVYDDSLEVLGEYVQSGLPSFALKTFGHSDEPDGFWTSVFLGEPLVSAGLIRGLGHLAGAHQFDVQEDTVNVSLPFVSIHVRSGGVRTVPLPAGWIAYDLTTGTYPKLDGNVLKVTASENTTYTYLVGTGSQLETLVGMDLAQPLEVGEIPERDLNIRLEKTSEIDIPILKFADYVEDALPDEVKEEWLLQPIVFFETGQSTDEPEEDSYPESRFRRGNRRKKRPRAGGKEYAGAEPESGISAFFRKRV